MLNYFKPKLFFTRFLMLIIIIIFCSNILKSYSNIPPEIPHERSVFIMSPYYFINVDGGEKILEEISLNHNYIVESYLEEEQNNYSPTCTFKTFLEAFQDGNFGVYFIISHGFDKQLAVEAYPNNFFGEFWRDFKYCGYNGIDENDRDVYFAKYRTESDNVDNDFKDYGVSPLFLIFVTIIIMYL